MAPPLPMAPGRGKTSVGPGPMGLHSLWDPLRGTERVLRCPSASKTKLDMHLEGWGPSPENGDSQPITMACTTRPVSLHGHRLRAAHGQVLVDKDVSCSWVQTPLPGCDHPDSGSLRSSGAAGVGPKAPPTPGPALGGSCRPSRTLSLSWGSGHPGNRRKAAEQWGRRRPEPRQYRE